MEELLETNSIDDLAIAIIGMSGRFPGAKNVDELWENLQNGVELISDFSEQELLDAKVNQTLLCNPNYVKYGSVLSDIELFDASFFNCSSREAMIMDPQQRLFLECSYEALENAGYNSEIYSGAVGVYAGMSMNTYLLNNLYGNPKVWELVDGFQLLLGNANDHLSTRVSYKLNLSGPSLDVQTACSTSLVAVHLACQSLLSGESDMALAGGVSVRVPQKTGYLYQEGMILSPDGHCRAFDAKAAGTVGGNGVGVVVLKRLGDAIADGDYIHAIIKGSAINNDGANKVGYTAPSVDGQAAVISEAHAVARIDPKTITYIETHGTGTPLGDPIEIAALTKAFSGKIHLKSAIAIGSIKTNMGHLDAAAGITSLIKTVLALKNKTLPPSLHFTEPNPKIDFANSPFYVNSALSEWKTDTSPRRAGVSSFGIGGTNAHVILEEAPETQETQSLGRSFHLLTISAKTSSALDTATANLIAHLQQHPEINLADVAYTLNLGRRVFTHKRFLVCQDLNDAVQTLSTKASQRVFTSDQNLYSRPVVFMFSGQGAQYLNMTREIYQLEPTFREQVDICSELLKPSLGINLQELLYPSEERTAEAEELLNQTAITQPALFAIEYALAKLWIEWGLRPIAMIGHSIGEYVAACLAKVFSLEEALSLVVSRSQMMQQLPSGSMLVVHLSEKDVQPLLGEELCLAAVNGPSLCVVSGTQDAVEVLQNKLTALGVECRYLHTSHAFHSHMMEPILKSFTETVKTVSLKPPQIPYLSNVTGTWITAAQATDPGYWARHLRETVRFADGLQELFKETANILLEVGPGRTLSTLAKRHPDKVVEQVVLSSVRHPQDEQSDIAFLLNTLGQLWLAGVQVDWVIFYTHNQGRRLPLPTYPFERERYWIEAPERSEMTSKMEPQPIEEKISSQNATDQELAQVECIESTLAEMIEPSDLDNSLVSELREQLALVLGMAPDKIDIQKPLTSFGLDSLVIIELRKRLSNKLGVDVSLASFLDQSSITEVARQIKDAIARSTGIKNYQSSPSLVALQSSGSEAPFFCVHPVEGVVSPYYELARLLGNEQPFYALQSVGIGDEEQPLTSIEEMANHYLKDLRSVQPEGPYRLGGWSFGALVAFEMALQLQRAGQKVDLLALIDMSPPFHYKISNFFQMSKLVFNFLLPYIWSYVYDYVYQWSGEENPLKTNNFVQKFAKKLLVLIQNFSQSKKSPQSQTLMKFRQPVTGRLLRVIIANILAYNKYVPGIYTGKINLFRASEQLWGTHPDSSMGWSHLAQGGVEIDEIPGNHFTILNSPNVQIIAQKLKSHFSQQSEFRIQESE
ncbi:type I polyketide synthase [Aetokthonos hydrillicola]|jgi:acyl transferase domain-containing protein|uniref:type I polyketide synthase n=1 Tax=Aetokthonos hydrillicola TaxID=1550245 RepID=UPI001ABB2525|nr:type I polyketide synthase [Aetokthonos hydrillicola]MBO3461240.1 acyltransferase domain-containing protein [Aetokthonos hydrillicola CCALA 1050]MBW4583714.1 acyltransferase domain-containing protein [Aetokthonos hydrillicola CCALA 1050]WJI96263.1 AesD [Aetokthonos hydrillicola Thurmond2011]